MILPINDVELSIPQGTPAIISQNLSVRCHERMLSQHSRDLSVS
ncbi:hypothetical protein JCM19238_711 [Vibrio ponticus]|nr:hypothetical protein JCM19238_711 [Vibrio ponticus]